MKLAVAKVLPSVVVIVGSSIVGAVRYASMSVPDPWDWSTEQQPLAEYLVDCLGRILSGELRLP
jgi:hypothetical protein